jgi:hypothetical protein
MLEEVAVILEGRDDSQSFVSFNGLRGSLIMTLTPGENMLCCVAPMCQTLSQVQLPLDLEPTKIQALLSTVADILTVRVSLCHLNAI